ncbi:Rexo1 protein [Schizophyllum amplum]|uniref:Rexo1 protein n=1 Tax=Schizophyllum amplum TaxID=97359 RepID=A0A550CSH0_9AGAR|nr:Rexo1 protein [Auriculariopsis ampla]
MFSTAGLFANLKCPRAADCDRLNCLFSHADNIPPEPPLDIPLASSSSKPIVPAKRPTMPSPTSTAVRSPAIGEPPRKMVKLGGHTAVPAPQASKPTVGVPTLKIHPMQSQVPIATRQSMLKVIYERFRELYSSILPANPTLASEHALRQEEELYNSSSKAGYSMAVIHYAGQIKRRPKPTNINHDSVGTKADIAARAEQKKSLKALTLTKANLQRYVHPIDVLSSWGYIVDIPQGPGGDVSSMDGQTVKCERCCNNFMVLAPPGDDCTFHWGKLHTTRINGERARVRTCCGKTASESEGCTTGPHVFYESDPLVLHSRHPFSFLPSRSPDRKTLDVIALDCEMIYTTGGMRVARVSLIDGAGATIFDEFVKMDEGVAVLDYNTRFSGVKPEHLQRATHDLAGIREKLHALMDEETILVGHALDNDLKTLRIVHRTCVDTALLFPHPHGAPYRKALRDLTREHLGVVIQQSSSNGHSSAEDASVTLDLVRWHFLNRPPPKYKSPAAVGTTASPTPVSARAAVSPASPSVAPASMSIARSSPLGGPLPLASSSAC